MGRPRKLEQDDRYNESSFNAENESPGAGSEYDEEGSLPELGVVGRGGRFAALRDEDFGENRS